MTRWTKTSHFAPRGALGIALLTLATGCAQDSPATTSTALASSTPSSSVQTPAGSTSQSDASSSAPASQSGTHQVTNQGNTYQLAIDSLTRTGQVVTLTVNLAIEKVTTPHLVDLSLLSDPSDQLSGVNGVPNGLGLLDPVGQKLYMPATRTSDTSTALCSPNLPSDPKAGDTITITCTYAAVPTNLTQVNVTTPTFGTYPNVTIH